MQGVVFKQRYNTRKCNAFINQKKLQYIATRPGAICNPNCEFGLFGNGLTGWYQENIFKFPEALKQIGKVSDEHTVYDCVISVDDETAKAKGLYDRAEFQEIVKNSIYVIQKEMDIDRQDFRWFASYHYKAGHPHVHIMYWDNSNKPRNDYIPEVWFEQKMEAIRAGFNRKIFQEELAQSREEKDEAQQNAKDMLKAMFRSVNSIDALNIDALDSNIYMQIGSRLPELAAHLPHTGALKYKYLPPMVKLEMNEYITDILNLPIFKKTYTSYLEATKNIAVQYGNTGDSIENNVQKAKDRLYTDLGNIILNQIKEQSLLDNSSEALIKQREKLMEDIRLYIECNPTCVAKYHEILKLFPKHATPISKFADDNFNQKIFELCLEIMHDPVISERLNMYTKFYGKVHTEEYPYTALEQAWEAFAEYPSEAKRLIKEELRKPYEDDAKNFQREEYSDIFKETRRTVFNMLYEDSGYRAKFLQIAGMNLLIRCFHMLSQTKNHAQHCKQHRTRDLSKQAKRDWHARHKDSKMEFEWER